MFVMTAKLNKKKLTAILLALVLAIVAIVVAVSVIGGSSGGRIRHFEHYSLIGHFRSEI